MDTAAKKRLMIAAIAVAAVAVAAAALIFIPRILRQPVDIERNLTEISANVRRMLSDEDLREVEDIVRGVIGDKFISAERRDGFAPALNLGRLGIHGEDGALLDIEHMREEDHEGYYALRKQFIGDRLVLTCLSLTEEEGLAVYTAISTHFNFIRGEPDLADQIHNPDRRDFYRSGVGG